MNVTRYIFEKDDNKYIVYIFVNKEALDFYILGSKYDDNLYHACYVSSKNLVDNFYNNIDEWINGIEKRENINYKNVVPKKECLYL